MYFRMRIVSIISPRQFYVLDILFSNGSLSHLQNREPKVPRKSDESIGGRLHGSSPPRSRLGDGARARIPVRGCGPRGEGRRRPACGRATRKGRKARHGGPGPGKIESPIARRGAWIATRRQSENSWRTRSKKKGWHGLVGIHEVCGCQSQSPEMMAQFRGVHKKSRGRHKTSLLNPGSSPRLFQSNPMPQESPPPIPRERANLLRIKKAPNQDGSRRRRRCSMAKIALPSIGVSYRPGPALLGGLQMRDEVATNRWFLGRRGSLGRVKWFPSLAS
ncbi:hypothetical protein QBC47DRAFT_207416 [Echria macrotheca]|uniref:Uncharacterized protein n=1 Tax=Echria macrotheca TaxID=438768 RepID=A0AAJ0F4W0_9PEZI|nr:hypothetical protein QBC47DRAFT_207416 [Echria macrotheca]